MLPVVALIVIQQIKPHYTPITIPGEGVLLFYEGGARLLQGRLYERLIPLLDGTHATDNLIRLLDAEFVAADIYLALISLQLKGYLCQSTTTLSQGEAAFWSDLGLDPVQATSLIHSSRVAIMGVGEGVDDVLLSACRNSLQGIGINVSDDVAQADLILVPCEDFLHPELGALNQRFRESGTRWLPFRPRGRELWLGPLIDPARPGCYACLSRPLARHRIAERVAAKVRGRPGEWLSPKTVAPGGSTLIAQFAALEVGRILADAMPVTCGHLFSIDLVDYSTHRHALIVDPHCAVCGDKPDPQFKPVVLKPCPVLFDQDGGHRHVSAEATLERFNRLVSPISGVVSQLQPVESPLASAHVVLAGKNPAQAVESLDDLRRNLRSCAAGKGASAAQAKASALCEALERFCGEDYPGVIRERASLEDMRVRYGDAVIHPNAVMGYSERQFLDRDAWNAKGSRFNIVPERLLPSVEIDWTPIWSLTKKERCYLPTQLLVMGASQAYSDVDQESARFIAMGCSNGNAAGNTLEEAVLQGFLELVERDSTAIWWYNRLQRPGIDLAGCADPWIRGLIDDYASSGREVWALDVTTDLGITTVVALSRALDGDAERILMGLGCHLDPNIAVQRALAEMNQMLGIAEANLGDDHNGLNDRETVAWLKTATIENQSYLRPDPCSLPRRIEELSRLHSGDLLTDIQYCCSCVEAKGYEVLVLDQTREHIRLPVVKVVVPGLRHFWARFAPGRLYDVPVRMGWLTESLKEEELNPIPIFF